MLEPVMDIFDLKNKPNKDIKNPSIRIPLARPNHLRMPAPVSHPTVYELLNLSDADLRFPFASTSRPAFPRPKAGMFT